MLLEIQGWTRGAQPQKSPGTPACQSAGAGCGRSRPGALLSGAGAGLSVRPATRSGTCAEWGAGPASLRAAPAHERGTPPEAQAPPPRTPGQGPLQWPADPQEEWARGSSQATCRERRRQVPRVLGAGCLGCQSREQPWQVAEEARGRLASGAGHQPGQLCSAHLSMHGVDGECSATCWPRPLATQRARWACCTVAGAACARPAPPGMQRRNSKSAGRQ